MSSPSVLRLFPLLTLSNILYLSITSQVLFLYIDPEPLTRRQTIIFDSIIAACLICYFRTWLSHPGVIPKQWLGTARFNEQDVLLQEQEHDSTRTRWCKRCEMAKPRRSHHCKTCQRCIPKMDHHCPWAGNCISYRIMPHFVRFLTYGVASSAYLQYFLFIRLHSLWKNRNLPSYLGPNVLQLTALVILTSVNSMTFLGLSLLFLRALYGVVMNITIIEGWEIERHAILVKRARRNGGILYAPGGKEIRLVQQEFPYDIGIGSNMVQAMGTINVLAWLWPFASSLPVDGGLEFEENGLEGPDKSWPPPDPDKLYRNVAPVDASKAVVKSLDPEEFRRRQEEDLKRLYAIRDGKDFIRQRRSYQDEERDYDSDVLYESSDDEKDDSDAERAINNDVDIIHKRRMKRNKEAWHNSEGETLADFGVDEDEEYYNEEQIPLAELMMKRIAMKHVKEK